MTEDFENNLIDEDDDGDGLNVLLGPEGLEDDEDDRNEDVKEEDDEEGEEDYEDGHGDNWREDGWYYDDNDDEEANWAKEELDDNF